MMSLMFAKKNKKIMSTTSELCSHTLFMGEIIYKYENRGMFGRKQNTEEVAALQALC